jgi:hypothetical protein
LGASSSTLDLVDGEGKPTSIHDTFGAALPASTRGRG